MKTETCTNDFLKGNSIFYNLTLSDKQKKNMRYTNKITVKGSKIILVFIFTDVFCNLILKTNYEKSKQ